MTKDRTSEQDIDQKQWVVKVEHLDATDPDRGVGELCVRLPDELMEQLGWEIGDEIEWEETEICEDWGEHKGCTLSNLTKNPKIVLSTKVICDVCGRVADEHETVVTSTLSGIVMCAGKMKDSCKSPSCEEEDET